MVGVFGCVSHIIGRLFLCITYSDYQTPTTLGTSGLIFFKESEKWEKINKIKKLK